MRKILIIVNIEHLKCTANKSLISELNNLKTKQIVKAKATGVNITKKKSHSLETSWFKNRTKNSQNRNENPRGQNSKNKYFYNTNFQQRLTFTPRYTNPNPNLQFQSYAMLSGYYVFSPYLPPKLFP